MVSQPNPELRVAPGPARSVSALLAAACGLAGMALAWHHPLGPALAVALFVAVAGLGFVRPAAWLVVVPALLPVIGLAPWSGWFTVEELDLLVLAFAAAGQARAAVGRDPPAPLAARPSPLTTFMIGCFTVATVVAIWRGVLDAGGPAFGWFQGYNEALNSVRTGKAWFLALLLLPLWRAAERRNAQRAAQRLTLGMALGLAGVVLAVAWERIAFTGLLNFSADYRATALFWEMHVGGAALDAYLALALPFALHGYAHARTPLRTLAQGALLVAACYACLTTFSRGVYLMLPVGVATVLWLLWRQRECHRERNMSARVRTNTAPAAWARWPAAGGPPWS